MRWLVAIAHGMTLSVLSIPLLGQIWASTDSVPIGVVSALVGVVGTALSGKVVVPTFAYNREVARADKWEAIALAQNETMIEFGRAGTEATMALNASAKALADSTMALHDLARRPPRSS